jgi:hypothetical protein
MTVRSNLLKSIANCKLTLLELGSAYYTPASPEFGKLASCHLYADLVDPVNASPELLIETDRSQ